MAEFLVELYMPRTDAETLARRDERIRVAAEEVGRVRFLRRILVPGDETCLLLYEADSSEAVIEAARRAGVRYERVSEAFGSD